MAKVRKKIQSTTKFIMFSVLALTAIVTIFAMFATIYLKDGTIIVTLLPCIFAECATVSAFYYWIRKIERMIKWKLKYGEEFVENVLDDAN